MFNIRDILHIKTEHFWYMERLSMCHKQELYTLLKLSSFGPPCKLFRIMNARQSIHS